MTSDLPPENPSSEAPTNAPSPTPLTVKLPPISLQSLRTEGNPLASYPPNVLARPENKEALNLWYGVLLGSVRSDPFDLSARQLALLLTISIQRGPHTVRGLSEHMNVSKPAICRALDTLSKYQLTERMVDKQDRRNVFIRPTEAGYRYLSQFSENILRALDAAH